MGDKIPEGQLEADLCLLLSGDPPPIFLNSAPQWPHDLRIVRARTGGAPVILAVNKAENTASIVSEKDAAGLLRAYCSVLSGDAWQYNVPFHQCRRVVQSWSFQTCHLVELPKCVGFKSDPDLCMKRLLFDPVEVREEELTAAAPTFAGILRRLGNARALCLRLGSMYDPNADRKQVVWLYGPGDSGKSDIAWLMQELSGNWCPISNADLKTVYWKAPLVGKRVAMVGEASTDFISSEEFKAITGDDDHSINQKNQPIYTARISIMLFFLNNPPEVPYDGALMTRIIACKIESIPPEQRLTRHAVRAQLTAELPVVAGFCQRLYRELESGARIPCDDHDLDATVEGHESRYLDFIEENFVQDPDAEIIRDEFYRAMIAAGISYGPHQKACKRVLFAQFKCLQYRREFQTQAKDGSRPEAQKRRVFVIKGIRKREDAERRFERTERAKHLSVVNHPLA